MNDFKSTSWPFKLDPVEVYAFWKNAFTKEECEFIIEQGKKNLTKATIFNKTDEKIVQKVRNSNVSWINASDESFEFVFRRCTDIINELNSKYFGFDLYGFIEGFQFTNYKPPNGKYGKHVDNAKNLLIRKLSITIQLTDPKDYKGGEFVIHDSDEGIKSEKEQGMLLAFPSYTLHEVTPVTKGERNSLVAWITGPAFK